MARSRALDLWRSAQAGGRAADRLKIAVGRDEARPEERPWRGSSAPSSARRSAPRSARCPTPQREAVMLAYWGGLTADEIARRSGVPLGDGQEPRPARARARCARELERRRDELDRWPAPAASEAA